MSTATKTDQGRRIARLIRDYRLRIEVCATVCCAILAAYSVPWWMTVPVVAILAGVVVWQRDPVLAYAHKAVYGSKIERQLKHAARDSGFGELKVEQVTETLPGEWVYVQVPRGRTLTELQRSSESLAVCLEVSDVRVLPGNDKSRGMISIIRRDPLLDMAGEPWPLIDACEVNIRDGIPFGRDEYGRVVNARLLSRNIILGGAPDAGKSTALRIIAAAGALDPKCRMWMMDGKTEGAEFIHWESAAYRVVRGRKLDKAVEMFAELEKRVEERSREIVARGEVFVCDDMELDLLIIDELPQFMRVREDDTADQKKAVGLIRTQIWKLISLGRWAGMMTVLAAQKPTGDVVPTDSRDLIDHKFALHCNTLPMSKAILGDQAGEVTVNACDIPSGQPGVGYYVGDDGPIKIRNFFISHKQALEVASRVSQSRMDEEFSTLTR